jgi:hypothetical protein
VEREKIKIINFPIDIASYRGRDAGRANGYLAAARRASSLAEFCFMVYAPPPEAGPVGPAGLGDGSGTAVDCYSAFINQ